MLSDRAGRFLARHGPRRPPTAEAAVRAAVGDLPEEHLAALLRFEERYGGLSYPASLTGNVMDYGLRRYSTVRQTPLGPAFTGIVDGDWTMAFDVLLDGRTAIGPGEWPYRVMDRSIDQRIEKHALLAEVQDWPHRTFKCTTPDGVSPVGDERRLPPAVPEASGPADLWWLDDDAAVEASLYAWDGTRDVWTVRHFVRDTYGAAVAEPVVYAAMLHETVPATWCSLCSGDVAPGAVCALR
jgi:hypothetical protein